MKRKIVEQGGLTLMISLPRSWAKKFMLKKGDEVEIRERNKELIVTADKEGEAEIIGIDITNLDDSLIWRYYSSAYRKGYDEIKLSFKHLSHEKRDMIRFIVDRHIGMEITEQGRNYITSKELSALKIEEFDDILKKTFMMISSMAKTLLEALKNKDKETLQNIQYMDSNVNKFTDFCFRILNKKGYKGSEKTTAYYLLVKQLEDIADDYKLLAEERVQEDMLEEVNKQFNDFYGLFYNFDEKTLISFARKYKSINKRLGNDKSHLKKINNIIMDMTDAMLMIK